MKPTIECVPNFCEGQNTKTLDAIRNAIESVSGIEFKCIDTGYYAHRSVYTFLGNESNIFDAAYASIQAAIAYIDMRQHHGTHPRFGAVDVFPFVALDTSIEADLKIMVREFAEKIALDFSIPTYLYEKSQHLPYRRDLAKIRKGEYEGLESKIQNSRWTPDFYPYFSPISGGMAMGVRNLLVAFNVNLDTKDVEIAKCIAEDIRYSGKWIIHNGERQHIQGICEGVKAIGWYIRDFEKVQVSMNIVDIHKTPVHIAYEACKQLARKYNVHVTGSELIGCIPRRCMEDAGKYYAQEDISKDYIQIAIEAMNMEEVKPFSRDKNMIEVEI